MTSTKLSQLEPEASRTARTLSNTDRHWAAKSKARKFPNLSSSSPGTPESLALEPAILGPTPERNNKLPTRLACG